MIPVLSRFNERVSKMKQFIFIITLFMLLGLISCGEDSLNDKLSDIPEYEVYVFMSASWSGLSRFSAYKNDDIAKKSIEEQPITFAYIRGNNVEMIFGPGPKKETIFLIPKGSYDFIDQQTLLSSIGVDAVKINTVVIESTCFDHIGGIDAFPNAKFVIQKKEFEAIPTAYSEPEDNEKIKKLNEVGRLEIIDGDKELVPGITAHFMGGHTQGTQFLSVNTTDGLVVLGGDGLYTYENLEYDVASPFNIGMDEQIESYKRIRAVLGDSNKLLVPGHDMEVFRRFPKITDRVVQIKLK